MSTSPWDILSARITRITDAIKVLPRLRQATLYATDPLQVVFDTDTEPTLAYATLVRNLTPGDRVLVANVGHYYWIMGVKGGIQEEEVVDTGWINLTLASGITWQERIPQYRVKGDKLYLRGQVRKTSGDFTASYTQVLAAGAIPDLPGIRDSYNQVRLLAGPGGRPAGRMYLGSAGDAHVASTSADVDSAYYMLNSEYLIDY